MDTNELFWATGIDNSGLRANQQEAIQIFTTLANRVTAALDEITQKYGKVIAASKVKFDNPVSDGMISGIKTQIETLGKTIDMEITKLGNFTAKYDQSMSKISKSAAKLQVGNNSPLAPMVAGIQKDVASSTEQLSFLERRFKYAFGSMAAYGSMRILRNMASEIIEVKTQFEFLQTAINSFAGNAEKGAKIMKELTQFATNSPLQVNDITEAAKQLMAFGVGADNVVGQIKMLSDVAAGAGKPIKDIAYIYGKSLTEGKVYTRTLMQFGNLGIPIYEALAKVMDTTPSKIKKMTQMGAVGFDDVKRAIESLTAAGGQYYGFSDKMMSTTAGLLSNVKDKWILAMKDMGESSDGFINMSVGLVDSAIAHWKELGDAIAIAAAAVGSYQVAKMVVNLGNNMAATTANLAEVASLETLVSAETKAAIAKTGFVVGSEAYGAAIRKEVAALLASATAEETAASARLDKITLKATEAETTLLSASAEEVATAQENFNTVSKERNIVATELKNATKKKEILINEIDSASEIGQVAATDLVAAAKVRLTAITATLNRTISANPYLAAGVALATLVTIVWALHDGTTAAERAQRALGVALDDIQARADKKSKQFSDNLDIIKNKALNGTKAQSDAYQILHDQFGAIIGDRKIEQLRTMDSVEAQNKMNKAKDYSVILDEKALVASKQQALYAQQERVANASETGKGRAQMKLKEMQDDLVATSKKVNEDIKAYNKSKKGLEKEAEDDTKDHWTEMIKIANENIGGMGSAKMRAIEGGTADKQTKDYYALQISNKKKAEAELATFPSDKQDKANTRAKDQRNREAAEAAKRLEAIRANNTELANLKSKAETDATQAVIDAMDAGYAKEKAQQENNFEKKKNDLVKQQNEMLKLEQQNIDNIFRNLNPNASKTKKTAPVATSLGGGEGGVTAAYTSLLNQATASGATKTVALIKESLSVANTALDTYNSEVDSTQRDNDAKLSALLEKQLLEYGDYTAKKTKIEKDYGDTLAALEKDRAIASAKGDTAKVGQIDSATIQANVNKAKDLMALSFDQLKSTPEFAMAFEDMDNVSTTTLEHLMSELEKFKNTAAENLNPTDIKEYVKSLNGVIDKLAERDPFGMLAKRQQELADAENALAIARANLETVSSGGQVITGYKPQMSTEKVSGKGQGVDTTKSSVSGMIPVYLSAAKAIKEVSKSQDDVQKSTNNVAKAEKTVLGSVSELSGSLDNAGKAIGGNVGQVISGIGQIGSLATQGISSVNSIVNNTTKGIGGVLQTATGVLGIITAAIQVVTTVVSMFAGESASTKAYKELKARSEEYSKVLDDIISKQKEMISNLDGMSAASKGDEAIANIRKQITEYRELAKAGGKAGASAGSHSYGYRTNKNVGKYYSDFSKSAGVSITDWSKLYTLTPEQLSKIKTENAYAWSLISSEIRGNLDQIITLGDSITELSKDINNSLAGVSFDSVKDGLDDLLKSSDTTMSDIAGNFEEYMRTAILQIVKDNTLTASLTQWYSDFVADMKSGGGLSKAESEALKKEYEAAYKTAQDMYDAALGAAGIEKSTSGSSPNSTASAIKGMDQPTADILTAQFSAVRIHTSNMDINLSKIGNNVSDLLLSLQGQAGILQIAFNDVAEIKRNTSRIPEVADALSYIKTYGIKVL